jgi:hypothetical protein
MLSCVIGQNFRNRAARHSLSSSEDSREPARFSEGYNRFQVLEAVNNALLSPMRSLDMRGHGREDGIGLPCDGSGSQIIEGIDLEQML